MDLFNSLSFQQSFIIAVAVSAALTALLAWVYILANRAKAGAEEKVEAGDEQELPSAYGPEEPSREEAATSRYLSEEVLRCQQELSSAVSILTESLEVCGLLSDQLYRGGIIGEAEFPVRNVDGRTVSSGNGSRLNISGELRKLYSHVEKNRRREIVV